MDLGILIIYKIKNRRITKLNTAPHLSNRKAIPAHS